MMSAQPQYIATRDLTAVYPDGRVAEVWIGIGAPRQLNEVMLAQRLARELLGYFVEDGGRILDKSNGCPIDLDSLFRGGI
jgi:hypothetical protein